MKYHLKYHHCDINYRHIGSDPSQIITRSSRHSQKLQTCTFRTGLPLYMLWTSNGAQFQGNGLQKSDLRVLNKSVVQFFPFPLSPENEKIDLRNDKVTTDNTGYLHGPMQMQSIIILQLAELISFHQNTSFVKGVLGTHGYHALNSIQPV